MSPPIRLAILEADTPVSVVRSKHGHYTGLFTSLLQSAIPLLSSSRSFSSPHPLALDDLARISRHHIVRPPEPEAGLPCPKSLATHSGRPAEFSYPPLDDVDAILITGSKHNAFSDDEWVVELVDYVRAAVEGGRVRVVGICYGHEILARALGSEVRIAPGGMEVAVTDVDLTEKGKEVFGLEKLRIHQMHRDEVASLPPGAALLGSTTTCPVQGFFLPGCYLTVQGHPEFTAEISSEILTSRHATRAYSDDIYEAGMQRVNLEHDGLPVAKAILEFLLQ